MLGGINVYVLWFVRKKVVLVSSFSGETLYDCSIDGAKGVTGKIENFTVEQSGSAEVELDKNIKVTVTDKTNNRYATFTIYADSIGDDGTQITFSIKDNKMYCDTQSGTPLEADLVYRSY